ncbi:Zn-dependent exopeptidase [Melanomma pulvis-pyrius CBS 109.77]|uniref:Zn-dependent exopeptidase n=1 Tax=Melanomma pulvis-pyrius CBS 109.77 TaxID=1314802 RepID=A0A6A6WP90_9PLEO|nr:Zn-dependent exopeptidase [Melanomma pulvis-pyrius CBS 109.77]
MLGSLLLLPLALVAYAIAVQTPLSPPSNEIPLLPESESDDLLYLHRKLVEIESITQNEKDVGQWLASYLRDRNFTVELQEVAPKRYNLLAYGKKRETTLLLTSHIDTVPPYWPYYYNKTSGIIGGRGSVDAKASVAAQIMAVQGLKEQMQDDISLLFVVGEETTGDGMRTFSDWKNRPNYDIVIFGEPTEAKLVCGHKGITMIKIKVTGKAAHSGYPWLGVSANDVIVEALARLLELREHLPWSEKYGNTTMNFGRVEGGVAANVVAETAFATLAVRIAAGTPKIIKELVTDALKEVKASVEEQGGELEIAWSNSGYGPVNIDCDVKGFEKLTVNYGTDVPHLKGDHKRYLYGPGSIFVAHSDHEALKKKELEQAVLDYRRLIVETSFMHHQERQDL